VSGSVPRKSDGRLPKLVVCLSKLERPLRLAGVALLGIYFAAMLHSVLASQFAIWQFHAAQASAAEIETPALSVRSADDDANFTLWSMKRIRAYKDSWGVQYNPPLAVLNIPKLQLTAPVFNGTDEFILNRGVGRIPGSSHPGEEGNLSIAGHRDGFFRSLKDISPGDSIELLTVRGKDVFVVDQIVIVDPTDVSVLKPRGGATLTLVTCYPFYFVGDAPQRYVVQASLKQHTLQSSAATGAYGQVQGGK
jgi:sortase A